MTALDFLKHLSAIPHLLDLAVQQDPMRRYQVQDQMRQQMRLEKRVFFYSMPMRHLYRCPQCGARGTDVLNELEDPRSEKCMGISQVYLHEAEAHATPPDEALAAFMLACNREIP